MEYNSSQKILLVGEGDFSFSLCLAREFGTAHNMVATSLDSRASLEGQYKDALSNLTELESLGCTILHGVDVHTMIRHHSLRWKYFHRIIFNFPHAGFIHYESNSCMIVLHQRLVSGFLENAKDMIYSAGEIHITHKTTYPFTEWDIKKLGELEGLIFIGEEKFDRSLYPGYNNKRGSGSRCDESFPVGRSTTFKFVL